MTKTIRSSLCLLTAWVLCLSAVRAEAPLGSVDFRFDTPEATIYDLSGNWGLTQDINGAGGTQVPLRYGFPLTHTASGRLGGRGVTIMEIGPDAVAANYGVSGQVFGGGERGPTRVVLRVVTGGSDVIGGVQRRFSTDVTYRLTLDPANGELYGTARGTINIAGVGKSRIASDVVIPIPGNSDGSWVLQLTINPLPKLVGTGSIILSNGRVLPVLLTGRYSAFSDRSLVSIYTRGEERGGAFAMLFGVDEGVVALGGTVLGQRIDEPPAIIVP